MVQQKLQQVLPAPEVSVAIAAPKGEWTLDLPKNPYHIAPGDLLGVTVANTLPNVPIAGLHVVERDGRVPLGPGYGRVSLKGLTLQEAEASIDKHLRQELRNPEASVHAVGLEERGKTGEAARDRS